ncbi:MAG: hypothetical protein F6K39_43150, partial [Okeania sp. SIO3B3]|nr:hypothetical protein [Okeania sp. SIO3B3]
ITDFDNLEGDVVIGFGGDGVVLGPSPIETQGGTGVFVNGDLIAIFIGVTELEVQSGLILI